MSGSGEQRKRDAETWRSTHSISSLWREVSISRVRQQTDELNSLDSILCIIVTLAEWPLFAGCLQSHRPVLTRLFP